MGFVLTDSVSADKKFSRFDLPYFSCKEKGIPICVNSYVTKYLPITVDNKGSLFNHVIKCGTKLFWFDLTAPAATTTRSRKARRPQFVEQ